MEQPAERRDPAPASEVRKLTRDFDMFRRDAYEYRRLSEEKLRAAEDKIRQSMAGHVKWAIGVTVSIIIALAANYVGVLTKVEKISSVQEWQDKEFGDVNVRLRTLEYWIKKQDHQP